MGMSGASKHYADRRSTRVETIEYFRQREYSLSMASFDDGDEFVVESACAGTLLTQHADLDSRSATRNRLWHTGIRRPHHQRLLDDIW
jgi:hypothetical protein